MVARSPACPASQRAIVGLGHVIREQRIVTRLLGTNLASSPRLAYFAFMFATSQPLKE
jgi:hypothetical protein